MLKRRDVSVKRLRSWAEDRYAEPISESDIQQVAAKENWVDMANFNNAVPWRCGVLHGERH